MAASYQVLPPGEGKEEKKPENNSSRTNEEKAVKDILAELKISPEILDVKTLPSYQCKHVKQALIRAKETVLARADSNAGFAIAGGGVGAGITMLSSICCCSPGLGVLLATGAWGGGLGAVQGVALSESNKDYFLKMGVQIDKALMSLDVIEEKYKPKNLSISPQLVRRATLFSLPTTPPPSPAEDFSIEDMNYSIPSL